MLLWKKTTETIEKQKENGEKSRVKSLCCCCWVASVMSESVWPQRWHPTRLPRPWDSPGKNTAVGCHFLLQCMKVKRESEVTQLMDCSPPGSSVHGIFHARVLEWGAIAFLNLWFYLFILNSLLVKINTLNYLAHLRIFVSFLLIDCIFSALSWIKNKLRWEGGIWGVHSNHTFHLLQTNTSSSVCHCFICSTRIPAFKQDQT